MRENIISASKTNISARENAISASKKDISARDNAIFTSKNNISAGDNAISESNYKKIFERDDAHGAITNYILKGYKANSIATNKEKIPEGKEVIQSFDNQNKIKNLG